MATIQTLKKRLLAKQSKCELCEREYGLEVHHIIPKVCGGKDSEENLIVVCSRCHSKLTPKGELTKIGIEKGKEKNSIVWCFANFYEKIKAECDNGIRLTAEDILFYVQSELEEKIMRINHEHPL